MGLREYRRKRRFEATPEPAAKGARNPRRIFVVQLHHASHRHYDFRLEFDGVLKSWAVPKGPSFDPAVKRLAMEVEDHPLSYAGFEGDIPKGNYGAGHVDIFDEGTWEPIGSAREGFREGDMKFVLRGDVLRGEWVLTRTRMEGSKNAWLLIKHRDEFAGSREANDFVDPETDRPLPRSQRRKTWPGDLASGTKRSARQPGGKRATLRGEAFAPELCKPRQQAPAGGDWLHEVKWDGYRIVATIVKGKVRLWSRNAIDWTDRLPALAKALASLGAKSAQLDGEILVLRKGRADFNALQAALSDEGKHAQVVYMLFDLPYLDGRSLRELPLLERKARLSELLASHSHESLKFSEHQIGNGPVVFRQAAESGLEGIVSKRIDSVYTGSRNGDWVKIKGRPSDEFAVIGYTEPKKSRAGIGALLLAQPRDGGWFYAGRVGTGFTDVQLRALRKRLQRDVVSEPAADIHRMSRTDQRLAIWVKPRLVLEAYYQGIGGQGLLRQPAFKAFREDKSPADLQGAVPSHADASLAGDAPRVRSSSSRAEPPSSPAEPANVQITHPDRKVFSELGITKADVVAYYRAVAPWLLAEVGGRPLSLVRCPGGTGKKCFFQKHRTQDWGAHVHGVAIRESEGKAEYLCIDDEAGLIELVQMNVIELHPWGARSDDPDHADRIVFDLDPHPSVAWTRVRAAARELRERMESIGLTSFLRTSGGKGLHVVVPLRPAEPWEAVKAFAQAVAQAMATLHPKEFVSVMGERNRKGRIFVDWLRNGRGATSVAAYSLRARPSPGVAMPLSWDDLRRIRSGDAFTIRNAVSHVKRRRSDPWADIDKIRQGLPSTWSIA